MNEYESGGSNPSTDADVLLKAIRELYQKEADGTISREERFRLEAMKAAADELMKNSTGHNTTMPVDFAAELKSQILSQVNQDLGRKSILAQFTNWVKNRTK
jgi:hypothetical protein